MEEAVFLKRCDLNNLHRSAVKTAYKLLMTHYILQLMRKQPDTIDLYLSIIDIPKSVVSENRLISAYKLSHRTRQDWLFITIFFLKDVEPKVIEECGLKLLNMRRWSKGVFAIELKGETRDNLGHNTHIHLLVKRATQSASKAQIIKALFDKFNSKFKGLIHSLLSIDVRPKRSDEVERLFKYISQLKSDKAKHKALEFDKIFRTENHLEELYFNNFRSVYYNQNGSQDVDASSSSSSSSKPEEGN